MKMNKYQTEAMSTAIFPEDMGIIYCTLALNGEAGELAEKVKKVIRDNGCNFDEPDLIQSMAYELGDVLWYVANLAAKLGYTLEEIADLNLTKLASRASRGKLGGSGDNR